MGFSIDYKNGNCSSYQTLFCNESYEDVKPLPKPRKNMHSTAAKNVREKLDERKQVLNQAPQSNASLNFR